MKVCELIEDCGVESVREKCINSEIVIPKRPKTTLKKLIINIQNNNKMKPEKVHANLIKLLVYDYNMIELTYPDETNKHEVYKFLASCNLNIRKKQANTFDLCVAFGHYLDVYFTKFQTEENEKPWQIFIKENFGISESYGRKLRVIAKFVNKYPKLRKLSISIREFLKLKPDISNMLKEEDYMKYWASV